MFNMILVVSLLTGLVIVILDDPIGREGVAYSIIGKVGWFIIFLTFLIFIFKEFILTF